MITASEARKLSGKTIQEYALDFEDCIKEAASRKERTVLKYHGELENEAYSKTKIWTDFVKYMKDELGFQVDFHYEERQFVDMRIRISW